MMEPPIAALLGTAVGALAGLAGPLVGGGLQAARDKTKWRLDNQRDAYMNALTHLSSALDIEPTADPDGFLAELSRAQAALGLALVFCSESQRIMLAKVVDALSRVPKNSLPEIAKIHAAVVNCARSDFHCR
jgi:hypothetical protein